VEQIQDYAILLSISERTRKLCRFEESAYIIKRNQFKRFKENE